MPDWLSGLIGSAITAVVALVIALVQRWRNPAETNEVRARAEKTRAETRLLKVEELEAKVKSVVDSALLGTAELIEQQRGEIVSLRNRVSDQDQQLSVMSETINTAMARIRQLECENKSLNAVNLRLIARIEELEAQLNDQ